MNYLFNITTAVLLLIVSSCRPEPIEIKIDPLEPEVVVFSQVIPGSFMTVALTKTISALEFSEEEGDSVSQDMINQLLVADATVSIAYRGLVDTLFAVTPGLYASVQTPQYINETYTLKVETTDGETLTSTSTMLPLVAFTSVTPVIERTDKDTTVTIEYQFTDLPENNWYMLNFYTPSVENLTGGGSGTGLDLNSFFNNNDNVLKHTELLTDEAFSTAILEGAVLLENVDPTDSLVITLSNINEDYYHFLEARKNAGNFFTELTKEPISYPTNIKGGRGFFNTHFPDVHFFDLGGY
jgi:hypothetical protein